VLHAGLENPAYQLIMQQMKSFTLSLSKCENIKGITSFDEPVLSEIEVLRMHGLIYGHDF